MKKILILLCLTFVLLSCTKEKIVEIEKIVEVEKEKPTPDALDKIETYLLAQPNQYGANSGATKSITADLKKVVNSKSFDYITIYGGRNMFNKLSPSHYGNDSYIVVLLWKNSFILDVRVYDPSMNFENQSYSNLTGENLKPLTDFSKNTYIGYISIADLNKK